METAFNKLNVDKQVGFINLELEKNKNTSVTKLCKKYGINKSTLISKFNNNGYKFNPKLRTYTKDKIIQNNNKNIITDIELKKLKKLLTMQTELEEIIQTYNKNKNIINNKEDPELKIDLNTFKGDLQNRLIKIYDNVNKNWIKFCKKNKQYRLQDLYSLALLEFIEKYN